MNPNDMPLPPLAPAILQTIVTRSIAGEGVVNIIRALRLPIGHTMEQLRRYHVDEIISAKRRQQGR